MEQLVNEKVDVFWKGIESGSNKRGQVLSRLLSPILPGIDHSRSFAPSAHGPLDPGHIFGKETQEVVVLCRRGRRAMGTMVCPPLGSTFDLDTSISSHPVHPTGSSTRN